MARLVIADDDAEQLEIRKLLLEASGHEVHSARTLAEAIRLVTEQAPDVLVMDLRMPTVGDGIALIRSLEAEALSTKIIVLSGWPAELNEFPERQRVSRVLYKGTRTQVLLEAIRQILVLLLMLIVPASLVAATFRFTVQTESEVVADAVMSSPGSDWARRGREAALATLTLDRRAAQHVMLYAGPERHTYSVFLGRLGKGTHQLDIERNETLSAPGSGLAVESVRFRQVPPEDPDSGPLAHAPVLFARKDTVGGFSDVPLLSYCERLRENGRTLLQYTVIFSNEDGGTSTRALMARWGRTTDIEYIYRAWLAADGRLERATIQAENHQEIDFQGRREGGHPVLIPSTINNMVSPEGSSAIRYQLAPLVVDLSRHSREQVMDEHPVTYRVMAQELEREGKLRPFGTVEGEKVSDPRNYLYLEAKLSNRESAVAFILKLKGDRLWRSSDLGRPDYVIERDGWVRTTVELPPGARPEQIESIGFACEVAPRQPLPVAGICRVEKVTKAFLLGHDYRPGPNIWQLGAPVEIRSGLTWTAAVSAPSGSRQAAAW